MPNLLKALCAAVTVTLLLTGCELLLPVGNGGGEPPLEGTSWEMEAYGPANSDSLLVVRPRPEVSYGPFTLYFEDEEVGGSDGCNSLEGFYETRTDGTINIFRLTTTLKDICYQEWPPPPHPLLYGALTKAISYARPASDSLRIYWRSEYDEQALRVMVFEAVW